MQKSYVTNNHFRKVLNELGNFLDNGQEPSEDLFAEFVEELRVSNLLVPGFIDGDDLISENLTSDEDGTTIIPLYTDDEEYLKDKGMDGEYNPIPNDIRYYADLLNDNDCDGLIINLASECFLIPTPLLNDLPLNSGISFQDNFRGYGPEQLKNIAEQASNNSFVDFIRYNSDSNNLDKLMMEFSKSTLLNVIVSDENLQYYANNGIIFNEDVGGFELCNTSDDDGNFYGILFTSTNAITSTMDNDSEFYYYYQIAVLSEFIDYVLRSDMEGIIINPGLDDYFIPRQILFNYSSILDNPSFKQAINYAFLL